MRPQCTNCTPGHAGKCENRKSVAPTEPDDLECGDASASARRKRQLEKQQSENQGQHTVTVTDTEWGEHGRGSSP